MKSEFIINLINAHCKRDENSFKLAVDALYHDEDRKGNIQLANSIRKAYSATPLKGSETVLPPKDKPSMMFSSAILPKDKDSTLDLLEITNSQFHLDDVILPEETTQLLSQILKEQRFSSELHSKNLLPTSRILLCGPPGCGKTLTAHVLAGEMQIPLVLVKLDGLVSSYLGQTGTNIRKIFEFVREKRCILFLDEFDAIAKKRDDRHEMGELKRVVTTLLQNMDALSQDAIVIAATNHHQLLDSAIWRRFDITIFLENPDKKQRERQVQLWNTCQFNQEDQCISILVTLTEGLNGAEIRSFLQFLAKSQWASDSSVPLEKLDICRIWLQYSTLFTKEQGSAFMESLQRMRDRGLTLRELAEITGMSKSSLSNKLENTKKEKNHE